MTRSLGLLLLVAGAAMPLPGCQADDNDDGVRKTFTEDQLSLVPPDGWEQKRQKDTLVFVGGAAGDERQPTIAIRSVARSDWSEPRTTENLLPSVATVLRALPDAELEGPVEVDHPVYRAHAFDVVFTPRSRGGTKYERRHVVVVAGERVFHAFLTAPVDALRESRAAFDRVLASLREEV